MGNRPNGTSSLLQGLDGLDGLACRLPGEDPDATSLDVARRWAQTYDHLTSFERELLEQCQDVVGKSGPKGTHAVRDSDVILLEVQVSRFQLKREYWRIRAIELSGTGRNGGGH